MRHSRASLSEEKRGSKQADSLTPACDRSLGIGFGTLVFAVQIYTSVVLAPVAKWLDKELDEMEQMDEKELETEPIFIAFPFTTKSVDSLPYRGTDEEWQTFIKVNKDQNLQMKIRSMCASHYWPSLTHRGFR